MLSRIDSESKKKKATPSITKSHFTGKSNKEYNVIICSMQYSTRVKRNKKNIILPLQMYKFV